MILSEKQSKFVLYVTIIQFSWDSLKTEKDIIETEVPDLYLHLEEKLQAEKIKYKVHGAYSRNSKETTVAGVQWEEGDCLGDEI